jgi:hypothetical protein
MTRYSRRFIAVAFMAALSAAIAASPRAAAQSASPEEAQAIAMEAYIYLYPLIMMDVSRRQMTNIEAGKMIGRGPMNTFASIRTFPPADFREVVRPNFDTLYSISWLDLTVEPVIVSVPDTQGRYYLLPLLDMWTDVFAVPGKRATGTAAADFAIVPPGWNGTLLAGVERINSPTPYVWVIGRTQTNGPADYAVVHKVQDGFKITLLSDWGKTPRVPAVTIDPGVDMQTPPLRQVNAMPATDFFKYGAELMKVNPPHMTDWSVLARMRRIGFEPGKSFDPAKADSEALARGAAAGLKLMRDKTPTIALVVNGWQMNTNTMGVYGNYYLKRAIVAMIGLGANQPEDAVYPINIGEADGQPLRGESKYVLHFNKDELPPVDAFWSVTMYDAEGFQVANPINRFAIGDRDALKYNADGSLDLYFQHDSPGGALEANWLPSPASGILGVTMRLYAPKQPVLDGRWNPPAVQKAN